MARYDIPDEPYFLGEVIGSAMSYHRPTCHIIRQIKKRNYKRLHDWQEAWNLGLKPCPHCRPFHAPGQAAPTSATPAPAESVEAPATPSVTPLSAGDLGDRRRVLLRLLDKIDQQGDRPVSESVAGRIGRLSRASLIPREVAACMRTITEMRNVAEYEAKTLSSAESAVVEASWLVIKEWALARGIVPSGFED